MRRLIWALYSVLLATPALAEWNLGFAVDEAADRGWAARQDAQLVEFRLSDRKELRRIPLKTPAFTVERTRHGLLLAGADLTVHHLTLATGKTQQIANAKGTFNTVVHPSGERIAVLESDGQLRVRSGDTWDVACEVSPDTDSASIILGPWSKTALIVSDGTGLVDAYDWQTCAPRDGPDHAANVMWIAPDGERAVRLGAGGIELFSVKNNVPIGTLPGSQVIFPLRVQWRGDDVLLTVMPGPSIGSAHPSVRVVWWRAPNADHKTALLNGQTPILDRLLDGPAVLTSEGLFEAAEGRGRLWRAPASTQPTAVVPLGDTGRINDMAFHPVGHLLAVASEDGVSLWDVASGQMTGRTSGYACTVDFTWAGGGMVVLGPSIASLFRVQDLSLVSMRAPSDGSVAPYCQPVARVEPFFTRLIIPRGQASKPPIELSLGTTASETINPQQPPIWDIAFSPNTRWLTYSIGDRLHCSENVKKGRRWATRVPVSAMWMGITNMGRVVRVGLRGELDLVEDGKVTRLTAAGTGNIGIPRSSIALAGEALYVLGYDAVHRWDLTRPADPPSRTAIGAPEFTDRLRFQSALAVRPDGKVAAVARGASIQLVDLSTGRSTGSLQAGREGDRLARRDDGSLWVTTSAGTSEWRLTPPDVRRPVESDGAPLRGIPAIDPKGRWIATPGSAVTLRVGDAIRLLTALGEVSTLTASPDGQTLVATAPGHLLAIDPMTGTLRWKRPLDGFATAVAVHGDQLAVITRSKTNGAPRLSVRALEDGRQIWSADGPPVQNAPPSATVAMGPWGVAADWGDGLRGWTAKGAARATVELPFGDAPASLMPSGAKRLLIGTKSGVLYVVDMTTGKRLTGLQLGDTSLVSLSPGFHDDDVAALDSNGQVHLVRPKSKGELRPLARLMGIGDRDFVIETDTAHWSSPGAARHLAWRAAGKLVDTFDAELTGNRPAAVLETLGAESGWVDAYQALVDKRRARYRTDGQPRCPTPSDRVWWESPPVLSAPVGALKLTVKTQTPCAAARLRTYVDGVLVGDQPADREETTVTVELVSGANQIEVVIEDGARRGTPARARIEGVGSTKRRLFALAIGVSSYTDARRNLTFAAKDAHAIATAAKRLDGFDDVRSEVLVDADATADTVRQARAFLRQANAGDTVLVFLSGHGLLTDDDRYVFATHETDFERPAPNGLRFAEITGLFDGVKARRRMLWMDTCHAGEVDPGTRARLRPAPETSGRKGLEVDPEESILPRLALEAEFADLRIGTGLEVFSSSLGGQSSYEDEAWAHGAFTRAILRGLNTLDADTDADGRIRMSELVPFVRSQVQAMTKNRQTPVMRRDLAAVDPIVRDRSALVDSLTIGAFRTGQPIRLAARSPGGSLTLVQRRGDPNISARFTHGNPYERVAPLPKTCRAPVVIDWPAESLARLGGEGCDGTTVSASRNEPMVIIKRNFAEIFRGKQPTLPAGFAGITLGMPKAAVLAAHPSLAEAGPMEPPEFHGALHWVDFDEPQEVVRALRVTLRASSGLVQDAWGEGHPARDDIGREARYWFNPATGLRARLMRGYGLDEVSVQFTAYHPAAQLIGAAGDPHTFGFENGTSLLGATPADLVERFSDRLSAEHQALLKDPKTAAGAEVTLDFPPTEFEDGSMSISVDLGAEGVVDRVAFFLSHKGFARLASQRLALLKARLGEPTSTAYQGEVLVFERGKRRVEITDSKGLDAWSVTITPRE